MRRDDDNHLRFLLHHSITTLLRLLLSTDYVLHQPSVLFPVPACFMS